MCLGKSAFVFTKKFKISTGAFFSQKLMKFHGFSALLKFVTLLRGAFSFEMLLKFLVFLSPPADDVI